MNYDRLYPHGFTGDPPEVLWRCAQCGYMELTSGDPGVCPDHPDDGPLVVDPDWKSR